MTGLKLKLLLILLAVSLPAWALYHYIIGPKTTHPTSLSEPTTNQNRSSAPASVTALPTSLASRVAPSNPDQTGKVALQKENTNDGEKPAAPRELLNKKGALPHPTDASIAEANFPGSSSNPFFPEPHPNGGIPQSPFAELPSNRGETQIPPSSLSASSAMPEASSSSAPSAGQASGGFLARASTDAPISVPRSGGSSTQTITLQNNGSEGKSNSSSGPPAQASSLRNLPLEGSIQTPRSITKQIVAGGNQDLGAVQPLVGSIALISGNLPAGPSTLLSEPGQTGGTTTIQNGSSQGSGTNSSTGPTGGSATGSGGNPPPSTTGQGGAAPPSPPTAGAANNPTGNSNPQALAFITASDSTATLNRPGSEGQVETAPPILVSVRFPGGQNNCQNIEQNTSLGTPYDFGLVKVSVMLDQDEKGHFDIPGYKVTSEKLGKIGVPCIGLDPQNKPIQYPWAMVSVQYEDKGNHYSADPKIIYCHPERPLPPVDECFVFTSRFLPAR